MAFFLNVLLLKSSSCLFSLGDSCLLSLVFFLISVIVPRIHVSSFYHSFTCYSNLLPNSVNSSRKENIWLESFGGFFCIFYFSCSYVLSHFLLSHYMFYCRMAMAFCRNGFTLLVVFSNLTWIIGLWYLLTVSFYLNSSFLWCFVYFQSFFWKFLFTEKSRFELVMNINIESHT